MKILSYKNSYSYFIEEKICTNHKLGTRRKEVQEKIRKIVKNSLSYNKERFPLKNSPVKLKMVFWIKVGKELTRSRGNMDLDNMIKMVGDALTGVIYKDDIQVREISAKKEVNSILEGISLDIYY